MRWVALKGDNMHSLKFALVALALALAGLFLPAFSSPAFAQSCTSDGSGRCCLGGVSTSIVKKGHFQTNGKGYSKGEEHHSYAVKIPNSCNVPLVVGIEFDCRFSGQIIPGEDRIPPGGKVKRYDVLRPGCRFNVWEKVKGKRADLSGGNAQSSKNSAPKENKGSAANSADGRGKHPKYAQLTAKQRADYDGCLAADPTWPEKSYNDVTKAMANSYSGSRRKAYVDARRQLFSACTLPGKIMVEERVSYCYYSARYNDHVMNMFAQWGKTPPGRKYQAAFDSCSRQESSLIYDRIKTDQQTKNEAKSAMDAKPGNRRSGKGAGTDGVCAWSTQKCKALGLQ